MHKVKNDILIKSNLVISLCSGNGVCQNAQRNCKRLSEINLWQKITLINIG